VTPVHLVVNGEPLALSSGSSIADVVARLTDEPEPKGIAVAVDRTVIPRSEWSSTLAEDGTSIEVVTAAAGG
jgi:sulfur carrier protein